MSPDRTGESARADAAAAGEAVSPVPAGLAAALGPLLCAAADRHGLPVAVKDLASGRYLHANAAMARLLGVEAARVVGSTDAALLGPARAAALRAADDTALACHPSPSHVEHRLDWPDGRIRYAVTRIAVAPAEGGPPRWLASLWSDLSAAEDREAALHQALRQVEAEQSAQSALRAALAEAQGRAAGPAGARATSFEEQLRREWDLSNREQREFALVLVELDAPVAADTTAAWRQRAVETLDRLLLSNIRAMDATSQLTDSRFTVLLSGVGLATAHSRIESLRRQCATQIVAIDGSALGFTISVGVASYPHTANTREDLVRCATEALVEAQRRGGNQVKLASIRFEAD